MSEIRRTKRWPITVLRVDANKNGSMPISRRRGKIPAAELVCKVENTKWPVRAACTAKFAVSVSRISPTITTSGSWRKILLRPEANDNPATRIQNTDLDVVTSKISECDWIAPDSRFTLTRTLCSIKANIKDYLQYVMYIGLAAATILLIWNWFKIVTASDQWKQIGEFKKNLIYIVIWVVLLIWFYYIIDIFVSVVNLVAE